MTWVTGRALCVLALLLTCGCSGADEPRGGAPATTATAPESESEAGARNSCDTLPDLPTGRIVFTQVSDDGSAAIHLMKPDGTDRRCLVDTAGPDTSPAWSPDGRWVAFQGGTAEQEDLYLVRADGTGLRRLTDTPEWEERPVWSPDGRRLAYGRSRMPDEPPWSLRVMSADGSHDTAILSSDDGIAWAEIRDWSPDGTTLLIQTDDGGGLALERVDPDGRHRRSLRAEPGDVGSGAVYSPDGRSLVFQADRGGGCLFRSDPLARRLVRLTHGCSTGVALTWSPDGGRVMWAAGDGGADLEVMSADGSGRRTVVDAGDVATPDWQPEPH